MNEENRLELRAIEGEINRQLDRGQVSPETREKYQSLMKEIYGIEPGDSLPTIIEKLDFGYLKEVATELTQDGHFRKSVHYLQGMLDKILC